MLTNKEKLIFPDLLYFEDYKGNFQSYFIAVYKIFEQHFIKSSPFYIGVNVYAQKKPLVDGIHRTFYHITHEGEVEEDRHPDIRRMERIRYPKFIIEQSPNDELLVWEKRIGSDQRLHIFNEAEGYIVVLTRRKHFFLFWTAFYIQHNHQKRKKLKEYENYIKAKTA